MVRATARSLRCAKSRRSTAALRWSSCAATSARPPASPPDSTMPAANTSLRWMAICSTFKAYRRDILDQVPLYGELHRFIPALASWHGATICEVPIRNVNRERGVSHYGITRTFRVFFDLLTIRFLLRYLSRPLHFFGTFGMASMFGGTAIVLWLGAEKFLRNVPVMAAHGPLMMLALGLLLGGVNLLAIGLLGEMQVRHYHEPSRRAPYSIDRVLRSQNEEHSVSE